MSTLHRLIKEAQARLLSAGVDAAEAALDAELLARHVLGCDRARLLASWQEPPPASFGAPYERAIGRRAQREPVAYIVGVREFWNLELDVTPDVLVPRPETELIVEEALEYVRARARSRQGPDPIRIADVGTGSGCLAIALAVEVPGAHVTAIDTSVAALEITRRNARRHGVERRVATVACDLLRGVSPGFDLIVSNPPYIRRADLQTLPPEVSRYEPVAALDGGVDGLETIRRLLDQATTHLAPEGRLIFELGADQAVDVSRAIASHPELTIERIRQDLQGIPRTAVVRRTSS